MGVCFESKDKKNKNTSIKSKAPIINLDEKITEHNLKIQNLETIINSFQEKAKQKLKAGDRSGAKRFLAQKKKYVLQKEKIEGALSILEDQKMTLENVQQTKDVFDIIKKANEQIKEETKGMNVEDLNKLKEEMDNLKVDQEEINDFFTGYADVNEEDVDEELENLFQQEADNLYENLPNINNDNGEQSNLNEGGKKSILVSVLEGGNNQKFSPEMKKEINKREKEKNKIMEKQKEFRRGTIENKYENKKKEEIKEVLEDMCIIGSIMKKEIIEEKKYNPKKFIPTEKALEEKDDESIFCLGLLAQNLENLGIVTAIEKNSKKDEKSQNAANTILQFLTNGLINKNKYNFHFDFGPERNKELLNNKIEQKKFNDKLRKKLSIEYNIPENKIILTNPQKGSYEIQVIFETDEFNTIDILDINKFKSKCKNDKNFKELCNLKTIHKTLIMEGCKLTLNMLDSKGNRESGWEENGKRGGYDYIPPKGWKGFGLKVLDKYDLGNNDWLGCDGNPNEWAVAYHGIGTKLGMKLEDATHNIIIGGFKAGGGQAYENYDDDKHPGKKIGKGVYCSPDPTVMDHYAHSTNKNGKQYKMGFMMRVKPDTIRCSSAKNDYWVLNGKTDEMRPYRILIKEV